MESVPEDMENRRLADLEKFALTHPNHPMVPLLMKQVHRTELGESEVEGGEAEEGSWYQWLREQQLRTARKGKRQQSGGRKGAINKWDKASSLELLAASKNFQDTLAELSIRGIRVTSDSRWNIISQSLPNRYGLEPAKYARSCKVHFMNLCRVYRAQGKNSKGEDAIDPQVRRALDDYFQLGDVNVPRLSPLKGLEVKTSVKRVENATNVKMSNHEDKSLVTAKAGKIALEKHSKRRPDKVGNPRTIEDTQGVEKIRMQNHGGKANQDPHEQEELGNPYRREQRGSPTMDSGAILQGWDTASTLQLLAAVRKVGPKAVNRWEVIASQLPNHCKLDYHEYLRSCKEQYRALLHVYTREKMQLDLGHTPLVDEVHAQLEKWLLLQSTTSKANHLTRKEISGVERRDTGLEGVGVEPACNPCIKKQNNEEGKGIPKAKGGPAEKNREKTGFAKPNCGIGNGNDLEHHTIGLTNESSRNDAANFDSDDDSERELDECRRRINKTSIEQDGEKQNQRTTNTPPSRTKDGEKQSQTMTNKPPTRTKGFTDLENRNKNAKLQEEDVKRQGIYKTYIDSIVGTSSKLQVRNTFKAALLNSSGFNRAVHVDQLENCAGLGRRLKPSLRRKFQLGSDHDDRSCNDSMHLDEDDSASEGDESKRTRKKRLLIMNRMLKKRAERNKADNNRVG